MKKSVIYTFRVDAEIDYRLSKFLQSFIWYNKSFVLNRLLWAFLELKSDEEKRRFLTSGSFDSLRDSCKENNEDC